MECRARRLWYDYSRARDAMFEATDTDYAPWYIIDSTDKRRARLAVLRRILLHLDYPGKDHALVGAPDPQICRGVDIWNA